MSAEPAMTDAVPYFPFKLMSNDDGWLIRHPLTGTEHKLNEAAYWLLRLCDGYSTWGEIAASFGQAYRSNQAQVMMASEPLLQALASGGTLWWRQQRMTWSPASPPAFVLWDLTAKCNLACRHCVVSAGAASREELSLAECCHLVDDLRAAGVPMAILSGGEPLLHPDFFAIAEYAERCGLVLQVATNATLITEAEAQRLAALGIQAQVSLDGATPETHGRLSPRRLALGRALYVASSTWLQPVRLVMLAANASRSGTWPKFRRCTISRPS